MDNALKERAAKVLFWCNSHQREATHTDRNGRQCCARVAELETGLAKANATLERLAGEMEQEAHKWTTENGDYESGLHRAVRLVRAEISK